MSSFSSNYSTVALVANQAFGSAISSQISAAIDAATAVWQELVNNRDSYVQRFNAADVDLAIQNARIVFQAVTVRGADGNYRDAQMAANVEWIAAQNPNARIVLWAHDFQISKQPGSMGGALADYFGSDYANIGQYFHAGTYTAINSSGLGPNVAESSFPGRMEYMFHSTGGPQQILDLHLAHPGNAGSSWLLGTFWDRTVGAVAEPGFIWIRP